MELTSRRCRLAITLIALTVLNSRNAVSSRAITKRSLPAVDKLPELKALKEGDLLGPASVESATALQLRSDITTLEDLPLTPGEDRRQRELFKERSQSDGVLSSNSADKYNRAQLVQHLYAWRKANSYQVPSENTLDAAKEYMASLKHREITLEDFKEKMLPVGYEASRELYTTWLKSQFPIGDKNFYQLEDLITSYVHWVREVGAEKVPMGEMLRNVNIPKEYLIQTFLQQKWNGEIYGKINYIKPSSFTSKKVFSTE